MAKSVTDSTGPEKPERDLGKIFDLNRSSLTRSQTAQDDLKAIAASAKEQEFTRRDIEAMKKIAKLRLQDKKSAAQEQLEALERIGKAVGFDLFDWASAR